MIASLPPARSYRVVLKEGMVGHEVYALQLLMTQLAVSDGQDLVADGHFGPLTAAKVLTFQRNSGLVTDGIVGVATQSALARLALNKADAATKLPRGLLKGLMENESGYIVGCVNWSVAGGVDAGLIQERIYVDDYQSAAAWKYAFGYESIVNAAKLFRTTYELFRNKPGAQTERRAWELAALNHNWPWGAAQLAKGVPLSTQPAQWVINIGVRGVTTPAQWAEFYISKATAYVTSYST